MYALIHGHLSSKLANSSLTRHTDWDVCHKISHKIHYLKKIVTLVFFCFYQSKWVPKHNNRVNFHQQRCIEITIIIRIQQYNKNNNYNNSKYTSSNKKKNTHRCLSITVPGYTCIHTSLTEGMFSKASHPSGTSNRALYIFSNF